MKDHFGSLILRPEKCLEERNIIVGLGSACNTSNAINGIASDTIIAMEIPKVLRDGVIRISLGSENTYDDAIKFIKTFTEILHTGFI